jgi:hypothetical protein
MAAGNPKFADIVSLLDALVPLTDPNISSAPHDAFWRGVTRDQFVAMTTDDWGVPGKLITPGNIETSNLYLALSGTNPFDGTLAGQMPDTNQDPKAVRANTDQLALVSEWIKNNAPS